VRYGSWSDKQQAFARKLLAQIPERERREAERAKEAEQAEPAPTGRVDVQGTVLTVKSQESDYGWSTKMLVRATTGWKLWVTLPSAIYDAKRGDTVAFTVTVEPSKDDPKFAFGKRPTKAVYIERAKEEE